MPKSYSVTYTCDACKGQVVRESFPGKEKDLPPQWIALYLTHHAWTTSGDETRAVRTENVGAPIEENVLYFCCDTCARRWISLYTTQLRLTLRAMTDRAMGLQEKGDV